MNNFKENISNILAIDYDKTIKTADSKELYNAVAKATLITAGRGFAKNASETKEKKVCYISAEFLIGRMIYNNMMNLGLINSFSELMNEAGRDFRELEDIDDAALGNGGLGRLAACFLDSGATLGITLNGYGLRYRYGLFKQTIEDGYQREYPDDWTSFGDPFALRNEADKVRIDYKDQSVYAVPYDNPVIGYGAKKINLLRLWQAEPVNEFNFELFNDQKYKEAAAQKNMADDINAVLYPNDTTDAGKKLRLKQQYLFSSATMQDIVRTYKKLHGNDFSAFADEYAVQLNDTHPVVSIPELIRIFVEQEGMTFAKAFRITREVFAYTNHTVLAEALEKWGVSLFKAVIPKVYHYIVLIQKQMVKELAKQGITGEQLGIYNIIDGNTIHMARLAVYATHSTNGVAQIHTDILKSTALKEWADIYPERFNNKTNGITQRRWLALANMELAGFINDKIGNSWITELDSLKKLDRLKDDSEIIAQFNEIKTLKKKQLADYIAEKDGVRVNPDMIFDVQAKRLHEYKRQLMNAFSILDIYYGIKEGRIKNFNPTVFIFGAKAAPGYVRAKGIIKYINEVGRLIASDPEVKDKLQVVFVQNYNVSYAEKIMPAADVSEQISTAGTEASGTGNMKFMLNGAVTLGTYDGANVEIVAEAGEENNYIFGARVEEIEKLKLDYNARKIYESNPRIKRLLDTLIDGTFDDGGSGVFRELYTSLLDGASWHKPDHYFILTDLIPYVDAKLKVNSDYSDRYAFGRKCFINMLNAGKFSSDRTIKDYAKEIWGVM